jgi:signal transduction histidine kinase
VLRWPSTLRWRLTLLYTALLAAPLVGLAFGFYALFARTLSQRTDRFIDDALTAFSRELVAERRAALSADDAIRSTVEEVRFRDLHIAVRDTAHRLVAMTPPLAGNTGSVRIVARPVTLARDVFEVTGTYSTADIDDILARIRGVLVIVIPLLVVAAAGGGYFMAAKSLAPVSAMSERAAEITATNLRERLPVSGGEELARLARVVNELLARLEDSFGRQRRFMADASHELRTPTAVLRTEADVILAQSHRSEEEYRASLTVIRDAAGRLARIVDDLFALARVDAENVATRRERVYVEELVDDAMRMVRALGDARGVRVNLQEAVEAPVDADADLVGRLLINLLDNAIKHSPDGGVVEVRMQRRDGVVDVGVIDQGKGIAEQDRERVFQRFVRLAEEDGTGEEPAARPSGVGLGLAIARRIAEAHGGSLIVFDSTPGRTEFRLTLPLA